MSKKMVLIDGNSILNRAFYGIPDLTNSSGIHTNAIYGFLNIMFKILDEEKPDYLTIAFDVKHPTFRHERYAEYKGTRKTMPTELKEQLPIIKEVLMAMNIRVIERAGYEADDILGTIARTCESKGIDVSLISGDRDLLQIATDVIKIRIPKTKKGKTEIEDYNTKDVIEKYGITPLQIIDLKGLMGDASDNIPGVPGIGEKTAIKILEKFSSVENAIASVDDVTPTKAKNSLSENKELAMLSKELATIKTDCELDYNIEEAVINDMFNSNAAALFKQLEFKNLMSRFNCQVEANEDIPKKFEVIDEFATIEELLNKAALESHIGIYILKTNETTNDNISGCALCMDEEHVYFLKVHGLITFEYLMGSIIKLINKSNMTVLQDLKKHLHYIDTDNSEYINEIFDEKKVFDTTIAAYLINPVQDTYNFDDIAKDYANLLIQSESDILGKPDKSKHYDDYINKMYSISCYNAYVSYLSYNNMKDKLIEYNMFNLMNTIEMPLVCTLFDMEKRGIRVNREELKNYGDRLAKRISELEILIYDMAGEEFNINSPKQLGVILFEKMNMPFGKKNKSGYSTSADILEKLRSEHPIVNYILEYRQLTKLKSTYADGLANYIEDDERIRSTFNQTITATGRISSTEPNLQNIPIRMELGREIRKVFIPKEGYVFADADYSQIELRVLAHMSGDEKLIEAYKSDDDIHKITASQVFHTPIEEVTSAQRSNAKAVNFGIVYGISSFGLGQDLNITRKEAEGYIKSYFETYPQIKEFLDGLVDNAKKNGYITTMFDRRRPILELSSSNFMQRAFGERIAMNSPIQGTAADIIKIAMIRVNNRFRIEKMKSKLILQIHDELLVEADIEELEMVKKILHDEMYKAANLKVALEVEVNTGRDWYQAK